MCKYKFDFDQFEFDQIVSPQSSYKGNFLRAAAVAGRENGGRDRYFGENAAVSVLCKWLLQ